MAEGTKYSAAGVIELDATDTFDVGTGPALVIESVIFKGTAAGTFIFNIDGCPIEIVTAANKLTEQVFFNRRVKSMVLTSGPTNAVAYVLLKKAS